MKQNFIIKLDLDWVAKLTFCPYAYRLLKDPTRASPKLCLHHTPYKDFQAFLKGEKCS